MGKATPLPSLTLFIVGILFTPYALLVESQEQQNEPWYSLFSALFDVSPRRPPPPPFSLPPPPPGSGVAPPPVAPKRFHPRSSNWTRRHPPPPPPPKKMNNGKKIGLLFAGIVVILQIGVVGFLVFKRRQLLKARDRYETCGS